MTRFLGILVWLIGALGTSAGGEECPIYPTPKQWENLQRTIPVRTISLQVSDPDQVTQYAVETWTSQLKNRFQQEVTLLPTGADVTLVLTVQPEEKTPREAFRITFSETEIHLTSRSGNGILYGLDALFQLFRRTKERGGVEIQAYNVYDFPSISHRGRPHFVLMQNLVPGALDAYAHARINFTDVRDNPTFRVVNVYPDRAAPMGFLPGIPVDRKNVRRMVDEAHRRGMFVYGTVAASSTKTVSKNSIIAGFDKLEENSLYEDVQQLYETLLELGVDSLWLSFDDVGAGSDSRRAIQDFLATARRHGLPPETLAYTPPDGDYQNIDTPFNRATAQIPEFQDVRWFFTRVPCEADTRLCAEIGLTQKPGWWHNLIFLRSGFLNNGNIAVSLRPGKIESPTFRHADGRTPIPLPAYMELQPLEAGWGTPTPDQIRHAAQQTDCVMLWCIGGGFPEEYLVTMFGAWAWNPEGYDWERTRTAIYDYVYGPTMVETARALDDTLVELKTLYRLPPRQFEPNHDFPPQLRNTGDRARALALLDRLDGLCRTLCENALQASALNADRLEGIYLEPLRKTLEVARCVTELEFPQADLSLEENERRLAEIEAKLTPELKGIDGYVHAWRLQLDKNDKEKKRAN